MCAAGAAHREEREVFSMVQPHVQSNSTESFIAEDELDWYKKPDASKSVFARQGTLEKRAWWLGGEYKNSSTGGEKENQHSVVAPENSSREHDFVLTTYCNHHAHFLALMIGIKACGKRR